MTLLLMVRPDADLRICSRERSLVKLVFAVPSASHTQEKCIVGSDIVYVTSCATPFCLSYNKFSRKALRTELRRTFLSCLTADRKLVLLKRRAAIERRTHLIERELLLAFGSQVFQPF